MIYATQIKMSDAGFDTYQLAPEGIGYVEFDTAEEYVNHVVLNNALVTGGGAWDADIAEMGDEGGEKLAAAIRKATGAVQGGHHTIVAFLVGDEVLLESVEEIELEIVNVADDDSKADLSEVWDAIDTPIYSVINERGENCDRNKVRRLTGDLWLSVDDTDGFQVMPQSDIDHCRLVKDEAVTA